MGFRRKTKKVRGSITVEASLSLVLFVFVMVSIISLINICRVQAKVGNALHLAAMDISNMSYLYQLTGLYDLDLMVQDAGEQAGSQVGEHVERVDEVLAGTESLLGTIANSGKVVASVGEPGTDIADSYDELQGNLETGAEQLEKLKQDAAELKSGMKGIADDPIGFVKILVQYGIGEASGAAKNFIAGLFAESMMVDHIEAEGTITSADAYLRKLGVENGLDGMSFMASSLFEGETHTDINLVAMYRVKVFPLLTDASIPFAQSASTGAWLAGDVFHVDKMPESGDDAEADEEVEETSAWEQGNSPRGEMIHDEVTDELDDDDSFKEARPNSGYYGYDDETDTVYTGNSFDTFQKSYRDANGNLKVSAVTSAWKKKLLEKLANIEEGDIIQGADGSKISVPGDGRVNVVYYITVPENISDEDFAAIQAEINKWLASISNPYSDKIGTVQIILRRGGGNSAPYES